MIEGKIEEECWYVECMYDADKALFSSNPSVNDFSKP